MRLWRLAALCVVGATRASDGRSMQLIHIPKTAGTALVSVLKQSPRWLQLRRAGVYVGHGKDFGEPQWRQIRDRRRATNGSVVVAEEIGLAHFIGQNEVEGGSAALDASRKGVYCGCMRNSVGPC